MCTTYNGWHSYETWLCNLWLDGLFTEDSKNIYAMSEDENEASLILSTLIEDTVKEMTSETVNLDDAGLLTDLLSASLRSIDYREIADHYVAEAITEFTD